MRGREVVGGFILSFIISLLFFFIAGRSTFKGLGIFDTFFVPFATNVYQIFHQNSSPQVTFQTKQLATVQKTVDIAHLEADNKALRDQFATVETSQNILLPARIVGAPQFLPGAGQPESIILDQGEKNGVKKGQAVVFKNAIVGLISEIHSHTSLVEVVSNAGVAFPGKTVQTNALGVLRGMGNGEMILDNVQVSDELRVGDTIVSSMGENADLTGYPPDLIIGKITGVQKNPSSLFQRARVISLVDITHLPMVFIITGQK